MQCIIVFFIQTNYLSEKNRPTQERTPVLLLAINSRRVCDDRCDDVMLCEVVLPMYVEHECSTPTVPHMRGVEQGVEHASLRCCVWNRT